MPLGITRLNARTQQPNPHITFLKPLSGQTEEAGLLRLSRVAAIVFPIMRTHGLAVMALEEFPPNAEFAGRNFNAGEVIQLVLRRRRARGTRGPIGEQDWLPDRWVQMVMIHELAHCNQMNHSKAFWALRDRYAAELKALWAKGYTGEGMWGMGRALGQGEHVAGRGGLPGEDEEPKHLCGGTYRTKRRKRRRKAAGSNQTELTYQEKKERRILKKFGTGGVALGADEQTRTGLEGGKPVKGKPRVAGSARGRELRAAAALARFDQAKPEVKKEEEKVEIKKEVIVLDDTDSETEWVSDGEEAAVDLDGKKLLDSKGHGMVKVCEDESNEFDDHSRRELQELYDIEEDTTSERKKPIVATSSREGTNKTIKKE